MAVYWLDVVRYADTGGYHSDNERSVWLYRDYVIKAFNDNKPFDRFTIEQLAGDLLPGATREQKIASGYNRLLQTTEEGGAQAKEYTAKYAADRVRNTATAWLGSTMGCCQCHDHKYDPFTAKDFYSFAAFFADVREKAIQRQDQTPMPTPEQAAQLKKFDVPIAAREKELARCRFDSRIAGRVGEDGSSPRQAKRRCRRKSSRPLATRSRETHAERRNNSLRTTIDARLRGRSRRRRRRSRSSGQKAKSCERQFPSTLITDSRAAANGAHPRPRQLAGRLRADRHAGDSRSSWASST